MFFLYFQFIRIRALNRKRYLNLKGYLGCITCYFEAIKGYCHGIKGYYDAIKRHFNAIKGYCKGIKRYYDAIALLGNLAFRHLLANHQKGNSPIVFQHMRDLHVRESYKPCRIALDAVSGNGT